MKELTVYHFFYKQHLIYTESIFPFWTPKYIIKAQDFLFSEGQFQEGTLAEHALTKLSLYMYALYSLDGQFFGFHFLLYFLKTLIVINFSNSRVTMIQIWGTKYQILPLLWKTLQTFGKVVNIISFFKNLNYY